MEPQVTEFVVHVEPPPTWYDAMLALFRPGDHLVRDEDIVEILAADGEGGSAAELCAARGITVPMYCVWRAKYRHLSLDEVRQVRRRERWRGYYQLGAAVVVVALAGGGIVFGLARATSSVVTGAPVSASPLPSRPVTARPVALQPGPASARQAERDAQIQPGAVTARAPEQGRPSQPGAEAIAEPGYKIQVAAAESLQEGRLAVERLTSAGYSAYLARAVVGNTEVFRVRVGPFDTLSAAEAMASRLHRDGYPRAWIAR